VRLTAELNIERQKSREREHECHVLKDEIQVTCFLIMLVVGPGVEALRLLVHYEVEHISNLRSHCSMRLCQECPRFLR